MNELDLVVLRHSVAEHGLQEGDLGTIVHRYSGGDAFEVEFSTADGTSIAVLTLQAQDIRPQQAREILHVRVTEQAAA